MKALFWFGLVVLVLGIASLFVAIPRSEREGIRAGNVDIGVQVKHSERVSPIVTAVLVIGGVGMMIARKQLGLAQKSVARLLGHRTTSVISVKHEALEGLMALSIVR
jgi:hypothetical protein